MPRDTAPPHGGEADGFAVGVSAVEAAAPKTVGERLRVAREVRGISLAQMAQTTKVGSAYLSAIEAGRIEALPSRPFAIGYVRAYADALGLDVDATVGRFRAEFPEPANAFRAPVGLSYGGGGRLRLYAGAAGAVVVAILLWNVAQRVMAPADEPGPVEVARADLAWTLPAAPTAPVLVGPAVAPPAEQTVPPPYETPGMAEWFAAQSASAGAGEGGQVLPAVIQTPPPPASQSPVRAAFNPQGAVYGAAPQRSTVIIQARKPGFVIVRGRDETIHFARQLAAGDAYRAPPVAGLSVEVSNPADFDLYRDGELQGALPGPTSSLDTLAAPPRG